MTSTQQPPAETVPGAPEKWAREGTPTTPDGWIARARELRDIYALDDAARDRANKTPYDEIALLKASGLNRLMGPVEHGGGAGEWPLAYKVIREVSAGDGSIGHLLGYHYMWFNVPRLAGTPEQIARIEAEATRNNWVMAGAINARDNDVVVRDEGDHLVFNGRKNFATGVKIADVTILEGVLEGTDIHVVAPVPTNQPGMITHDNWDNMGQRLTESGSTTIKDVRVPWTDAIGFTPDKKFHERAYATMNVPLGQLVFGAIWLGIAAQALDETAVYAHKHGKGWGGYDRLIDEPRVLDVLGDLTAKLWAAEALVDQVAQEGLELHRNPDAVTPRSRGEYKIRSASVKIIADATALEITSRIFEITGARSTAEKFRFDRFWRNARTHTLHDPVFYQKQEIGNFLLHDEIPKPGWYS